jgi:hypothetical protein
MTTQEIETFVEKWMQGHEPDTFVKDEYGRYMYSSGSISLNLKMYFEMLLKDYDEEKKDSFINGKTNLKY